MREVNLTCIGCPMGCALTAKMEGRTVVSVSGNNCGIGERYAHKELTNPQRTVTTTVRILKGQAPVVSVRTEGEIPKEKIFDCVRALKDITVPAPVVLGQVIAENICGTGVAVIATKAVDSL